MKYGLPYKGSKNKLAERIVSLLPKRTHLIDLFCGGCAVSHAALLRNKYEHIHINDINWMCPTLFIDALNGKYQNETRWISREDFFKLKDTDPYVAVVWSFGNNLRNYLYSKEIEPLKKAIHYAIFFHDYSRGKELGYDLSFIEPISDIQRRYAAVRRYFSQSVTSGNNHLRGQKVATNCKSNTSRGWGAESSRLQSTEAYDRINQIGECRKMEHKSHLSKKKNTNAQANFNRKKATTALHRLQYREQQLSLPRISGGAILTHHIKCT